MEETFLYTVNPRKVIVGLSGVNAIRTPKSLYLTKEDVFTCLKNATVYRRFATEGINERVNVGNVDRVHRENYISEEDWPKFQAELMSKGHGEVKEVKVEPKKEEKKPEPAPVLEEKVEEAAPVVEEVKEEVPAEEPVAEEVAEVEVESDDEAVENEE